MFTPSFETSAQLFDATLAVDLRLPDLTDVPADELAQTLVGHFLERREGDPADDALLVLLRSAVTNERAAARMRSCRTPSDACGCTAPSASPAPWRAAGPSPTSPPS
ncbi:hypothetical protein [Streptomyces sp. NPDC002328]|uniref:TetR/AcrR family transcriptional regulator n=1 Tax=Streptomyces sp. NPDC002328 TaxID=3364642 RepID=UPI0036CECC85